MSFLSLVPWYIKYPILAIALIAYAPSWIGKKFDERWEAKAAPYRRERDLQFKALEDDLREIKQDTRDIRNHLMGEKK